VLFEDFSTLVASTIGIITGSVATSAYSIHHFTCDITKIFQSPLPSLCILFHPSLAPPFNSSIAHYTIPRNLKTLLHITLHHEFYRHSYTLHNTPRVLQTQLHVTLHHEFYRRSYTLHNTPRALKTQLLFKQYATFSQETAARCIMHHEQSRRSITLYEGGADKSLARTGRK
jgi:hypothetical protein